MRLIIEGKLAVVEVTIVVGEEGWTSGRMRGGVVNMRPNEPAPMQIKGADVVATVVDIDDGVHGAWCEVRGAE